MFSQHDVAMLFSKIPELLPVVSPDYLEIAKAVVCYFWSCIVKPVLSGHSNEFPKICFQDR